MNSASLTAGRAGPVALFVLRILTIGATLAWLALGSARIATAQDDSGTPQPTVEPPAGADYLEVELQELNDSGVTGTVRFYDDGDQTIVVIDVEDAGEDHPAHIHAGTCDDIEPEPAYDLTNVTADGQSSTAIDVSLDDLMAAPYVIDLHLAPDDLGTLIDCAEITGDITPGEVQEGTPDAVETPEATVEETETPEATEEPTEEPQETATPDEAADGTGGAIGSGEDTASLPLEGDADLDVTGTVVLNATDEDTTLVSIVLSGDGVEGDHLAHIHDGTCDNPGEETIDLNPVGADGISETEVDLSIEELTTGGYFVNVHNSEADYETWLACGDLGDATIGDVVPEVAPETGGGGETPTPTQIANDGTTGDNGDPTETPVQADDLPAQAGTGSSLPSTSSPLGLAIWASAAFAVMLAVAGAWIRAHAAQTPGKWRRLGL